MPTYQYLCKACEHEFELYQSFSEDAIKVCPECSEESVQKIISGGAGVVFKGGGFYETDYKRGKGSDYANKASAEKGKGSTDSKKKSDSKPKSDTSAKTKKK